MVVQRLTMWILWCAATLAGQVAYGQSVPDPNAWLQALQDNAISANPLTGAAPSRIAVVRRSSPTAPVTFVGVKDLPFFLEVADHRDARWSLKINNSAPPPAGKGSEPKALLDAADADLLLDLGDRSSQLWSLVCRSQRGGVDTLVDRAKVNERELTPSGIAAFLRRTLGYDAIVLAQDGPFVLAETADLSHVAERYAVVVEDSADLTVIDEKNQKGAGFLALARRGTRVSVFRVLSSKSAGPFVFATKLILQKDPPPGFQ